jgi:hypothetical protein
MSLLEGCISRLILQPAPGRLGIAPDLQVVAAATRQVNPTPTLSHHIQREKHGQILTFFSYVEPLVTFDVSAR